ncbi:HAD domain-containing protein [Streptomyces sp. NBC_01795]|uniref:HAD domain-containing protein n=1 Tax=unclassified Streptomyces TaxID=2593676 RepID=UPI002DD7F26B|nr:MULTISPECIES: HAD domain-containing protein [unclassified Streptomyces]WSA92353.1 HAD domain-containing protein [Streptomyces sp. NBC_01795]WSS15002.1 HAD domain-containing protein [Streptomyces sp. NBC_01186]
MTGSAERPILFLDVDGPLIPFGSRSSRPRKARTSRSEDSSCSGNPLLERLDPAVGPRLLALGCDLVWASTWMDEANEVIAPRIGLPPLPVVRWPEELADEGPGGLHWKTRHIVEWAGHRSFIWVDDEISAMDRLWVSAQHEGQSLLYRVDPDEALTDEDFTELARWLRCTLPAPPWAPL